jgi:hypothetical protein
MEEAKRVEERITTGLLERKRAGGSGFELDVYASDYANGL